MSVRTGLQTFGFNIHWPSKDLAAVSHLFRASICRTISDELATGHAPADDLQYLRDVAQAVHRTLPLDPNLQLHFRSRDFQVTVLIPSKELTPNEQDAASPVIISYSLFPGLAWSHAGTLRLCEVYLKVQGRITAAKSDSHDENSGHAIMGTQDALQSVLETVFAETGPDTSADALMVKAASAISQCTSVFPSGFILDRVMIKMRERATHNSKAVTLAEQDIRLSDAKLPRITSSSSAIMVALGSNVGDRLESIETACQALDEDAEMRIVRTSALYETQPMYVEDQGRFLNGVCEVSASQSSRFTDGLF